MIPEERIKAITLRHAPRADLTEAEWQERLRQWKRDQAQERADELDLQAALRVLTHEQAQNLASFALTRLDGGLGKSLTPQSLLGRLANVVEGGLQGMYEQFLARRLFWPEWLYRGADAATRDQLFARLRERAPEGGTLELEQLLLCLAWIGDEHVVAQFTQWRARPPRWTERLSLPVEGYPLEAGWELTQAGTRRDLFYHVAYALQEARRASAAALPGPVSVIGPRGALCEQCGRPVTTLLEVDLRDTRLAFLQVPGTCLRIVCCSCAEAAVSYSDLDFQGLARVAGTAQPSNPLPEDDLLTRLPEHHLVLGPPLRTPYEGVGGYQRAGLSQLGGHPAWAAPASFPLCPTCGGRMKFLGQVEVEDLLEGEEGIFHAFLCARCRKAAVDYQQT
jgi:hypothetical protein